MSAEEFIVREPTGAEVLLSVEEFLATYVAFPSEHARVATVLWAGHTHAVDAFESSPRLAFLSPEPGSGKTRAQEVLDTLVPNPMHVLSASAAAIFRSIEAVRPTLLFDEVDALFGKRGADDSAEDLRALLNAGHRRGATIPRCVGPQHQVVMFPVYAAVCLAGLGDLPDTLMSRSVVIRMRRRAPDETVRPFRYREAVPVGHRLRDELARWAASVVDELRDAWPEMPEGVTDRPADVWEPLLAVADAAGGEWPRRAREACVALCRANVARDASLGIRLLTDLRAIFAADRMSTESILKRLHAIEESPWADLRGKPLDARGLARLLDAYGIRSRNIRIGYGDETRVVKGYCAEDLWDAWQRYCPTVDEDDDEDDEPAAVLVESATSATGATSQVIGTEPVANDPAGSATADPSATSAGPVTSGVAPVADVAPSRGPESDVVDTADYEERYPEFFGGGGDAA